MKRALAFVITLWLAALVGTAFAKTNGGTLVISHQTRGCHAWSYNGNANRAAQTVHLTRGASIKVVDNDVMSHKLIQKSGPAVRVQVATGMMSHMGSGAMMSHMGASVKVTFPKAGVYTFTTKAGEDYMKGVVTTGEDNVLRLKVVVS